ncbi:MAG: GGDEF domain-containing protein [Pseudomonadota bacterium]
MAAELINQLMPALVFTIFTLAFFGIWYQYRTFTSAGYFALSYLSGVVGFGFDFVEGLQAEKSSFLMTAVHAFGDFFYLLIPLFFVLGAAQRFGQQVPIRTLAVLMCVGTAGMLWFWFGEENTRLRSYVVSTSCSLMLISAVPLIYRRKRPVSDRALAWLVLASAVVLVWSTVVSQYYAEENLLMLNFWQSTFLATLNFTVAAISLSIAVVLLMGFGSLIISDLRKQSTTDVLSGVQNRRGFESAAEAEIQRALQSGAPLSLVMADLDHFKTLNDTYGHDVGDLVIREFAGLLDGVCRSADSVGRVGGEEFCILLPGAGVNTAREIAEKARATLSSRELLNSAGAAVKVTASFGVAELSAGQSYADLYKRADSALYAAKDSGRDVVVIGE